MVKNAEKFKEEGAIIDRILKYYRDSNDTIEQKKKQYSNYYLKY